MHRSCHEGKHLPHVGITLDGFSVSFCHFHALGLVCATQEKDGRGAEVSTTLNAAEGAFSDEPCPL